MDLIIAGIDEAGYGPLLGPMCVGLSVFRCPAPDAAKAPDLWSLLSHAICREPGRGGSLDPKGRIAFADSKKLKLSNAAKSVDPLVHLERGVLAALRALEPHTLPTTDDDLFTRLGITMTWHACYQAPPCSLPLASDAGQLAIASAQFLAGLARAAVSLLDLRCEALSEPEFNAVIARSGNKSHTTLDAVSRHIEHVWNLYSDPAATNARLGIICDRLGGRAEYADILAAMLPGTRIETLEESPTRSRYVIHGEGARRAGVSFLVEAEDAHLPVALASMTAKLVRELAMRRFNAYWSRRALDLTGRELKPTAGYAQDGRRWLKDAAPVLDTRDRVALVRLA
ncbi:MAG: hypothetical protein GC200_03175 [Tepidisphaera sp.]|nr:hypothetical protein [Tepidisphaera sp.]